MLQRLISSFSGERNGINLNFLMKKSGNTGDLFI